MEHTADTQVDTIVVADPQQATAQLLSEQLTQSFRDLSLLAVTNVEDIIAAARSGGKTLVVSEVRLHGGNVAQLVEILTRQRIDARVLVYSNPLPRLLQERLRKLPIAGVLSKTAGLPQVLAGIHEVAAGGTLPVASGSAPETRLALQPVLNAEEQHRLEELYTVIRQLTERQYAVLLLLAEGLSVKQVAYRISVSVKTVDSLKYRLMKQLQFHDRVELTRFAIREGLIDP